jgi:phosphonate degradation associated HDIG domain protein
MILIRSHRDVECTPRYLLSGKPGSSFQFTRHGFYFRIGIQLTPPRSLKMTTETAETTIDFIFELFAQQGAREYMGEAVSMAQHMEQSAACATADGAPDSLVIAALLHDIGHFVGEHPIEALENGIDNDHEEVGANYLAAYFPAAVSEPVRLHVAAKRYLCATDEAYMQRLSEASINSLTVQGGPMNAAEMESFEADPHHLDALRLRHYDDGGKLAGLTIKAVTEYREILESLMQK